MSFIKTYRKMRESQVDSLEGRSHGLRSLHITHLIER